MIDGLREHERPADLVLARVHLRLGSLALARAELETLAGRDELDADGLVDLAEARWRTGDLDGAGEAAVAALDDEDGPLLALIVAAEAAAARGRPSEARRLAERALAACGGAIDPIFAGMPRAPVWPPDASAPPPAPTTLFGPPHGPGAVADARDGAGVASADGVDAAEALAAAPEDQATATIELWDASALGVDAPTDGDTTTGDDAAEAIVAVDEEAATPAAVPHPDDAALAAAEFDAALEAATDGLPFGDEELERARVALDDGDIERAAVHLAFVLRLTPALAPIVVDLVGGRREPGLAFVRGDAYRLVGREAEALRAYADAARPPDADPTTADAPHAGEAAADEPRTDPEPDPEQPLDHDRPEGDPA